MVRVAVSGSNALGRRKLRDGIERFARENNINNVEVIQFRTTVELLESIARMRPGFFDMCFCGLRTDSPAAGEPADFDGGDEAGANAGAAATSRDDAAADVDANDDGSATPTAAVGAESIDLARKLHEENPDLPLVLLSEDKADAIYAFELESGFLAVSDGYDDFVRVASGHLRAIARDRSAVITVKSTSGVENVVLADIQFVESSKRGPIIHLPKGKTVPMRGTLQALFECLQGVASESGQSGAFVKAGSSFIVNLDNVRAAGEGSLIFGDGEAVIVPVRKRKAVLDALRSYRLR